MLLILFLFLCVVLFTVLLKVKYYTRYWQKQNIIQVDDLILKFILNNRSMPEICKEIYDKYDVSHIGTTMGLTPTLILKNLDDIQAVFAGDFQSFYNRGINTNPNDVLADNLLFTGDFQKWKLMRQKLSPIFTSAKLKNMFYILEKCARDFVEVVENNQKMRQTPFNVLYTYTTASVAASVFGIDAQTTNTMDSPFLEMAWKSVAPSLKASINVALSGFCPRIFNMLNLKTFGEHEDFFVGAVKNILAVRRHNIVKKRHDFIEICLEIQQNGVMQDPLTGFELNPTDEIIAGQAFFFFIAGADTTANVMHFALLELSVNHKVLEKLHYEIDSIFTSDKKELTYTDIESLQYLDMVVHEAMRKYPPIGVIQRVCTKDTVLPSGIKIAKNTIVVVPVLAIHRDSKHYPNPELFDPERFGTENSSNIAKFANLAFGEGHRICLGARMARLQVKVGLTWLLRRFTLAEQTKNQIKFEKSPFGLRDPKARYDFISRDL